jgi:protein-S-isoprenylcysteine O-methyltransferase Ste14
VIGLLARWRVPLGFLFGVLVLWLAQPTSALLVRGALFALAGESLRVWASGHLEKSREVTRSGPYRWTRHPLYLGSSLIALGVAIASGSWPVAALIAVYVLTTIPAAILSEEAHLRQKFGGEYDAYRTSQSTPMVRRFSVSRALFNREHHTIAGVVAGFALLALKLALSLG